MLVFSLVSVDFTPVSNLDSLNDKNIIMKSANDSVIAYRVSP